MNTAPTPPSARPWYRQLYVQVIISVLLGVLVGGFFPDTGKALKPLGDGFSKLVKMMIVPIESLAILVGIDRFMSECRALTNLIGNGVATLVVSRWAGEVSAETLRARLREGMEP